VGGFFGNPAVGGAIAGGAQQLILELTDDKCGVNWWMVGGMAGIGGVTAAIGGIGGPKPNWRSPFKLEWPDPCDITDIPEVARTIAGFDGSAMIDLANQITTF
jgi:hypothetical protein